MIAKLRGLQFVVEAQANKKETILSIPIYLT